MGKPKGRSVRVGYACPECLEPLDGPAPPETSEDPLYFCPVCEQAWAWDTDSGWFHPDAETL
jgi:hypothetical protein